LFYPIRYRGAMTDASDRLTPATPDDLVDALAFALRFDGRKRKHDAAEIMARIVAERLVEHLERSGFVVMKTPPIGGSRRPATDRVRLAICVFRLGHVAHRLTLKLAAKFARAGSVNVNIIPQPTRERSRVFLALVISEYCEDTCSAR
jgi:hypothetical protein